jgi:histidinol phosphatase-like PHP family hydrolase
MNVYVNPTFLPESIARNYDRLWTEPRMKKVMAAAAQHHIATEINSRYKLPSLAFIKLAKAAGCQFTFGTNNGDRDVGRLDYSFQMIREAGLQWQDMWTPVKRYEPKAL